LPLAYVPVAIQSGAGRRQRLFVCAVLQAERLQHGRVHDLWERHAKLIHHHQLHDRRPAAAVPAFRARNDVDAHRRGVGWPLTVEYLHEGWHRLVHGVAGEPVDGCASGVTQQPAQRHLLVLREVVLRHLPRDQPVVDVLVQRPFAGFDEVQRGHGGDRLADGTGLEQGVERHRIGATGLLHAVRLRPDQLVAIEDSDAQPGNFEGLHPLLKGQGDRRIALDRDRHLRFDTRDAGSLARVGEPFRSGVTGGVDRAKRGDRGRRAQRGSDNAGRTFHASLLLTPEHDARHASM
jgi:hypothetical protein